MTEFGLILVFVIESLYSVMRSSAFVFFWAFFSVGKFTKFGSIQIIIPPFILNRMKIVAGFMIVRSILSRAFNPFEILEIQVSNRELLSGPVVDPSYKYEVTILVCLNDYGGLRKS